jgi:hypothetical protein
LGLVRLRRRSPGPKPKSSTTARSLGGHDLPLGVHDPRRQERHGHGEDGGRREDNADRYAYTVGAEVVEGRFRGTSSLALTSGDLVATFLPDLGMTGVSLQYRGAEHLALPGGLDALRAGATLGLPLLAPWANRLATRQYRAGGVGVDLRGLELTTDDNGLPMHGLLVGNPVGASGVAAPAATPRGCAPPSTWTPRRSRSRIASS